ncbi:class I SAM-dependent methyltransferase [Muricoccus radiodurans]|uniref:class I SAM-dependent methyltransferase n=1 Tax=Muricoccus radiodurans TaxID=2231721 RepID=UPI003CF9F55F
MDFDTFLQRFGGSLREKNLNQPHEPTWAKTVANRRRHFLSHRSELPRVFIRQDPWEAEYLFMVAARARIGILEIGRFNGGSIFLMACANPAVPLVSIDIAPRNDQALLAAMEGAGVANRPHLIVGDSRTREHDGIVPYDLLFIDGDHSYEGCTADLETWYPALQPGGHVILHDSYRGSPVMDAAIDFLERHDPVVHVSPYKHANHSTHPAGSLAHFQKRRPTAPT